MVFGGDFIFVIFVVSIVLFGWIVLWLCLCDIVVYVCGKIIEFMCDGCIVFVCDGFIVSINVVVCYLLLIVKVYVMLLGVLNVVGILCEFECMCLLNCYQVWLFDMGCMLEVMFEGLSDVCGWYVGVFLLLCDVMVEQLQCVGMVSVQDVLCGELQCM